MVTANNMGTDSIGAQRRLAGEAAAEKAAKSAAAKQTTK